MTKRKRPELKALLDEMAGIYNRSSFVSSDPVSIPHRFSQKEDIEVAGFLTAIISWGNRKSILVNASSLMERMDNAPHEFVMHHSPRELRRLDGFVHRTFNSTDAKFFVRSLRNIYTHHGGLESAFSSSNAGMAERIHAFRKIFLAAPHEKRAEKHISDPLKNSSAKRICMFLRWMVRKDNAGVDFGIWKKINPGDLMLPLDVHSGRIARQLGLLQRIANDWKAVEEATAALRQLDPLDPVKYDFALFGMGVNDIRRKANERARG